MPISREGSLDSECSFQQPCSVSVSCKSPLATGRIVAAAGKLDRPVPAASNGLMSRSESFEAKAAAAERLSRAVPAYSQVYNELARTWHQLARQAEDFERSDTECSAKGKPCALPVV
jgi:hypothetical protein